MNSEQTRPAAQVHGIVLCGSRLVCWAFGHVPCYNAYSEPIQCKRCDCGDIPYEELVCDSRYARLIESVRYYGFRKWWPRKCRECGHRWRCDDSVSHVPF